MNFDDIANGKNSGHWSDLEKTKFIEGLLIYGKKWSSVSHHIKTRSVVQVRSHSQKFFLHLRQKFLIDNANSDLSLNTWISSKIKEICNEMRIEYKLNLALFGSEENFIKFFKEFIFKDKSSKTKSSKCSCLRYGECDCGGRCCSDKTSHSSSKRENLLEPFNNKTGNIATEHEEETSNKANIFNFDLIHSSRDDIPLSKKESWEGKENLYSFFNFEI